jgi:hypothetical protein
MSNNPFKPPDDVKGNAPQPREPSPNGSPLKAVLTGLAIDICGSTWVTIVLATLYQAQLGLSGMTADQVAQAMDNIPPQSLVAILDLVLGALCSVAGGYACARVVGRNEYRIGAVMASISGVVSLISGGPDTPDDMLLLLTLCTIACNMLGVKFGRERNLRVAAPAAPPGDAPQP